jgi:Protein of unknown function (DUF 659)
VQGFAFRMAPKKRSPAPVLDHFTYVNTRTSGKYDIESCNYCGDSFKRQRVGTDVLKAHLVGTAAPCKKVPQDVREVFTAGSGIGTGSSRGSKSQQQLGCSVNPALQKQAAKDIALWAFATGTSFSAVDNSMFMSAMRSVAKAGVAFKPPSRKQLATTLLDTVYDETKSQVQAAIEKHRKYGFSLCSDGWSDVNSHPLINVVLMIPCGQYFLGSVDASGVTKNGDYISAVLKSYIEQVGPADIACIVTDNASNCTSAGELVEMEWPHITWLGCIPHCLNLLMGDMNKLPWVSKVVIQVSKVRISFLLA